MFMARNGEYGVFKVDDLRENPRGAFYPTGSGRPFEGLLAHTVGREFKAHSPPR
jgi:hypothetical protein